MTEPRLVAGRLEEEAGSQGERGEREGAEEQDLVAAGCEFDAVDVGTKAAQFGELAIHRLERLVGEPGELAAIPLDGVEAGFQILAGALKIGELVIARVFEAHFESLEALVAARLLGHLGYGLAGLLQLALEAGDGAADALELDGGLGYEAFFADPLAARDARGNCNNSFTLQHDATPPTPRNSRNLF
ncbi:protein of unknown function [Hyphomicrobium sp. 1Nfss2.1]